MAFAERVGATSAPQPDRVLWSADRNEGREQLRLAVRSYRGREFLDLRLWWRDAIEGEFRPSQKGTSIRRHELPQLLSALEQHWRDVEGVPEAPDPTEAW